VVLLGLRQLILEICAVFGALNELSSEIPLLRLDIFIGLEMSFEGNLLLFDLG